MHHKKLSKIVFILFIHMAIAFGFSQNQFPSDSNVIIDGQSIVFKMPSTSGGWARGSYFHDPSGTERWGGIGLYGGGTSLHSFYIAYGTSPWNSGQGIYVRNTGNVGIGITDPGTWKLAVNGNIRAKEIKVETGWADYVFEKDYPLPSLEEVERHILEKGHLINIPSAEEVEANGIEVGEMNRLLLEKIEELTLYIINQDKRIKKLENQE